MPGTHNDRCAAVVVGRGPAGLTAAIALAKGGASTLLVGTRPAKPDNRTTALLADSVTALDTLGVWSRHAKATIKGAHHR
jgi:2-octaprenyl-6-methoxyphenol hydroxylase